MEINGQHVKVEGYNHLYRSDNQAELGYVTNVYKPVQPAEVLEWFQQYISADDRFKLDVAGSLRGGKVIWATATFNGDMTVAGDRHVARLLMSTSFDSTYATINKATMTRVVCNNTLDCALADKKAQIKTRHNSKWNSAKVGKELGDIIGGFAAYKKMGDAMVQIHLTNDENEQFARKLLGLDDKADADINTRKLNQLNDIRSAYAATVAEGTEPNTAWALLNAVTRYVDHDRGTRDMGHGETESRFFSAQFSSGAALKSKAVGMLYEMNDGELLKACVAATEANRGISRALQQPLMVR
jgi:phage/plasmid-like protein (TIGR03299 family)